MLDAPAVARVIISNIRPVRWLNQFVNAVIRVCRTAACEGLQRTSGMRALPASKYSLFVGSSLRPKYTRSPMVWVGSHNSHRSRPFSYALPLMRVPSAALEMVFISGRSASDQDQIPAEQTASPWQSLFHAEE